MRGWHHHHTKAEMPGLSGNARKLLCGNDQASALPQPSTLCNLSMYNQTLSGSWKYKCQVLPHENSCGLGNGDKQPHLFYPFSKLSPSPPFFPHSSVFLIISLFPAFLRSLLSFPSCVCAMARTTCPLVCGECCSNVVWQLLRTMASGCFVM